MRHNVRHKASGRLVRLWCRCRRGAARVLDIVAGYRLGRALVALTAAVGLGFGGFLAIDSMDDGTATRAIDTAPTVAGDSPSSAPSTTSTPTEPAETPAVNTSEPEPSESTTASVPAPPVPPPSPTTESATPTQETGSPHPPPPSTSPPDADFTDPHDTTPPTTSLLSELPGPDSAQFTFSANEDASFTCSLDDTAYVACDSPQLYSDLKPGWHTFAVKATDTAGNADPSPAEARWKVNKDKDDED